MIEDDIEAKLTFEKPKTSNIVFRMYTPEEEELKPFVDLIDPYPREAQSLIDGIIEDAHKNAPDAPESNIILVPKHTASDLKRLLKPQIKELIGETYTALLEIRKEMQDQ